MSGENIKNSLFEMQVNLLDIQIMAKQSMLLFSNKPDELKKDIAILKKKRARLFREKIEEMDYLSTGSSSVYKSNK
jgi:hypothetical protein